MWFPSEKAKSVEDLTDVSVTSPQKNDLLVYDGSEWENSDVLKEYEVIESDNLCPVEATSQGNNGVTYAVTADGIISTSGATTTNTSQLTVCNVTLPQGTYKVVGCPTGGSSVPWTYYVILKKDNANGETISFDTGDGGTFTLATDTVVNIRIIVNTNIDMSGKIFKPMITKDLNATYDDFVPFYKALNVTYTINAESIVTASWSSTPTGDANRPYTRVEILSPKLVVGKTYRVSGCPSGGAWGTGNKKYIISVYNTTDGTFAAIDTGEGATFTPVAGKQYNLNITIGINAGASGSLTFKPMITTDLNATYADYVPYAPVNKDCMSYAVNTKLGAHNLLNVTAVSQTLNGITYTIDEDKVITINTNGTLSAKKELRIKDVLIDDILVGGKSYIFTINQGAENPDKVSGYVNYKTADNTGWEDGILVDTPFTHIKGRYYGVWITLDAGANYSNLKIYPMIKAVEDTDETYSKYVMTNEQLTEVKTITGVSATSTAYSLVDAAVKRVGNIVQIYFSIKILNNVAAGGNADGTISGLPLPCMSVTGDTYTNTKVVGFMLQNDGLLRIRAVDALVANEYVSVSATYICK